MTPMMGADTPITAEQFAQLPGQGKPLELIRGKVVSINMPAPRHGQICSKVDRIVGNFVDENKLGHVVINDSGVITERGPDTVRGADVAFYSFARVPPGRIPRGYLNVVPELIFEIRSPTDRWAKVLGKVAEYLAAEVSVVCVLDQVSETIVIYQQEELPRTLHGDDELSLPDILKEFRVPVQRFFE